MVTAVIKVDSEIVWGTSCSRCRQGTHLKWFLVTEHEYKKWWWWWWWW